MTRQEWNSLRELYEVIISIKWLDPHIRRQAHVRLQWLYLILP